jgi:Fe-S-cluster-containing dehydrogenase component
MKKWHMIIDVSLCQGCNNCFLACRDEHVGNDWPGYSHSQSQHGERWIQIPCNERGRYPHVDVAYRPTPCTHCSQAPCVSRSGGAITKRSDGLVLIDPKKAAGRRDLVDACPYGAIVWSEDSGAPQKCTLCAHLLDDGWTKPRCVQVCGPGALSFVREDDETFARRVAAEGLVALHAGRPGDTAVCYKNLSRFDSCFIAGSVAVSTEGVTDCAIAATVTLSKMAASAGGSADACEGGMLQTAVTDVFGDFKFDGLDAESGDYCVEVAVAGHEPVCVPVSLGLSTSLGTILVEGDR